MSIETRIGRLGPGRGERQARAMMQPSSTRSYVRSLAKPDLKPDVGIRTAIIWLPAFGDDAAEGRQRPPLCGTALAGRTRLGPRGLPVRHYAGIDSATTAHTGDSATRPGSAWTARDARGGHVFKVHKEVRDLYEGRQMKVPVLRTGEHLFTLSSQLLRLRPGVISHSLHVDRESTSWRLLGLHAAPSAVRVPPLPELGDVEERPSLCQQGASPPCTLGSRRLAAGEGGTPQRGLGRRAVS